MLWRIGIIFSVLFWSLFGLLGVLRIEPSTAQWITFISTRDTGSHQIYRMRADGSHVERISDNLSEHHIYPQWITPQIVIGSNLHGIYWRFDLLHHQSHIIGSGMHSGYTQPNTKWLVSQDIDQTRLSNLWTGESSYFPVEYDWETAQISPDQKWLLLRFPDTIQILNLNTRQSKTFAVTSDRTSWSQNSRYFLWQSSQDGLWVATPDGTQVWHLIPGWHFKLTGFSPDGEWLLFSSSERGQPDLYRVRFDGSEVQQLTDTAEPELHEWWSPDGQIISYSTNHRNVVLMSASRPDQQLILSMTPDEYRGWIDAGHIRILNSTSAQFFDLPVGFSLKRFLPKPHLYARCQVEWCIWLASANNQLALFSQNRMTQRRYQLTPYIPSQEFNFSLAPDGQWILFQSNITGTGDIYKVRPDGSELTNLTHHPDWDIEPAWSPVVDDMAWRPQHLGAFGMSIVVGLGSLGGWRWWAKHRLSRRKQAI